MIRPERVSPSRDSITRGPSVKPPTTRSGSLTMRARTSKSVFPTRIMSPVLSPSRTSSASSTAAPQDLAAIERGGKRHQRIEHHLSDQRIERIDRLDLDQRAALGVRTSVAMLRMLASAVTRP